MLDSNTSNNSTAANVTDFSGEFLDGDDAIWALSCAFLIFTMQTGFAMLESGAVSPKNITSIMIKNVIDVSVGGLGYWIFGYAISFGQKSTRFFGYSDFFFHYAQSDSQMGSKYTHYFFQLSFAATSTTIFSGAIAERCNLTAYMFFSFLNNIIYCIPVAWVWNPNGFLRHLGFYDFAGVAVVHVSGGASALVGACMLGPRTGRFEQPERFTMSSPVTSLTGMFMLWWAWLGFNCGSTMSMTGNMWKLTSMVAITTLNGANGGGIVGMCSSMMLKKGKVIVEYASISVLGGLVAVTGIASVTTTAEALFIGAIGGGIAILSSQAMIRLKIDDPVSAAPVHLFSGIWGVIAIGLHAQGIEAFGLGAQTGILHGGSAKYFGVQILGTICIITWSSLTTFIVLKILDKLVGIRMSPEEEAVGADYLKHDIKSARVNASILRAVGKLEQIILMNTCANPEQKVLDLALTSNTIVRRGHGIYGMDTYDQRPPDETVIRTMQNAVIQTSTPTKTINKWKSKLRQRPTTQLRSGKVEDSIKI